MGLFDSGILGNIGNALGTASDMGSPAGVSDYRGSFKDWKKKAAGYADEWGQVNEDVDENGNPTKTGKRFDELSRLYGSDVDRSAALAGAQTAGAYSRRGAGDSGYALGGQQDVMLKAALARTKAREAARTAAVGESGEILQQQQNVDLAPYEAWAKAATQRYLGNEDQWNKFQDAAWQKREEWFQDYGKMGMSMGGGGAGGAGGGGG